MWYRMRVTRTARFAIIVQRGSVRNAIPTCVVGGVYDHDRKASPWTSLNRSTPSWLSLPMTRTDASAKMQSADCPQTTTYSSGRNTAPATCGPFIGTEPPNNEWKRARGLVFSGWKSERENVNALRDAFRDLPLYATQFGPEHADRLDLDA